MSQALQHRFTKWSFLSLGLCAVIAACGDPSRSVRPSLSPTTNDLARSFADTGRGHVWVRNGPHSRKGIPITDNSTWYNTTLVSYLGGGVLGSTTTYAIFTGPDWNTNSGFTGDKISSIQSFLSGFGNSRYATILTEYSADGVTITPQSTFGGTFVDNQTNWTSDPGAQGLANYVCGVIHANNLSVPANAVFIDYVEAPPQPQGNGHYWGVHYHDNGYDPNTNASCGNLVVAMVFNTDGYNYENNPEFGPATGYNGRSTNAANLANTTAHELAEAITDPSGNTTTATGWRDNGPNGQEEIGDKCGGTTSVSGPSTLSNGDQFNLQSLWSNKAFGWYEGFVSAGFRGCTNTPAFPPLTVTIIGPSQIAGGLTCTWSAQVSGGIPPYTYYYWQDVQHDALSPQQGSGQTWSAQVLYSWSTTELAVSVLDSQGNGASNELFLNNNYYYDHTYCH